MKYGNRSTWTKTMSSPITIVVLAVVFILLARTTWNIRQKSLLGENRLDQAKTELAKLGDRKANLAKEVGYLSTEQGIEAELRTKYRAVKEGESVAVILDDKQTAAVANSSTTQTVDPNLSWWSRLLHVIGL